MLSKLTTYEHHCEEDFDPQTIVELLRWRATHQPDQIAYTFLKDEQAGSEPEEAKVTYAGLDRRARTIGARLQRIEAAGKRALLVYPSGLEFIEAFFGSLYAGVIAVPTYPPDPSRLNRTLPRLQAIAIDSRPTVALTTSQILSFSEMIESKNEFNRMEWIATDCIDEQAASEWRCPEVSPDTIAFLQYTSGSTASPKGVIITHENLVHNQKLIQAACQNTEESTFSGWLPLYHDMGLIGNVLQPLYIGARCILMSPGAFLRKPARWLQSISRYKAVVSGGPNFAFDFCVRKITPQERAALDLSSWKVAFNGAEPVRKETIENFASVFGPCGFQPEAFFPCYGLAEATLIVSGGNRSSRPVYIQVERSALERNNVVATENGDEKSVSIVGCGSTLLSQVVKIVTDSRQCGPDEIGEIWVSGPSISKGYWDRPEETRATFHGHLVDDGEEQFLRTGDLGFIRDGQLFITGRLKDLIVIRGLNHYPQDIERIAERCHTALRQGCGAVFSVEASGEEQLVIVNEIDLSPGLNPAHIVELIRQAVAEHFELQPLAVVLIKPGTIPKTSSGKIQRRACRAMFQEKAFEVIYQETLADVPDSTSMTFTLDEPLRAANPSERQALIESYLSHQISRSLGMPVSLLDRGKPLSRFGLDSLMAVELSVAISNYTGASVAPVDLLQASSISELARQLAGRSQDIKDADVSMRGEARDAISSTQQASMIKPVSRDQNTPLSFAQMRLWFLDQLLQGSAYYNIPIVVRLSGPLNVALLEGCLNQIKRRHEILRTHFENVDGRPIQVISPPSESSLELVRLDEIDGSAREAAMRRVICEEVRKPFDLMRGPLMRAMLVRVAEGDHLLILTIHHIVSDGWSVGLLLRELSLLYQSGGDAEGAGLEELAIQYADYAVWESEQVEGARMREEMEYWKEQLGGELGVMQLPTDRPRPPVQSFRGARCPIAFSIELSESIKALSRERGVTLFMTLLAALYVLLYRYTGQNAIGIGTAFHNRTRKELLDLIGFFANTVVLRADLSDEMLFLELLDNVREISLGAHAHQGLPFEKLVEELQPERDLSYTPLFQVMFVLQNDWNAPKQGDHFAGLAMERLYELEGNGTSKRDLTLYLMDEPHGINGLFEYDIALFDQSTINRMAAHFQTLLESIIADPAQRLSALPILSEQERRKILVDWNSSVMEGPQHPVIQEVIEAQAGRTPDSPAIIFEGEVLTYGALNKRANQLAHYLREIGVRAGEMVGLCARRSLEMVVGVLGIIKAGAAYVPLDPSYPKARSISTLEDSRVALLLTYGLDGAEFSGTTTRVISIEAESSKLSLMSDHNPANLALAEGPAYVIYTSGSTGEAKGVVINHKSLRNYVDCLQKSINITARDRYLHTASIAFSSSVRQLMLPLSQGAAVVLASSDQLAFPRSLFELIRNENVTVIDLVPSYWQSCNQMLEDLSDDERASLLDNRLRLSLSASEPLRTDILTEWKRKTNADAQLINMFGQTETTGIVAVYPTPAVETRAKAICPIGRPIANTQIYILDDSLQPVPIGVPGEIYIAGKDIADRYLNRPALTAEKFIPNCFSVEPGARLYRTGDIGRFLADGNIEFIGRTDYQIKIRGIRFEPAEVEAVLSVHPAVRECAVVAYDDSSGGKSLAAYFVPNESGQPSFSDLRSFLKPKLPAFMLPAQFVPLEKLPRTSNGKVDRRALLKVNVEKPKRETQFLAPRNAVEARLAEIWAESLGISPIGINDNFFELGGHSLLASRVISRACDAFKVSIPLRKIFEEPTIASLSLVIGQGSGFSHEARPRAITPVPRGTQSLDNLLQDVDHLSLEQIVTFLDSADTKG